MKLKRFALALMLGLLLSNPVFADNEYENDMRGLFAWVHKGEEIQTSVQFRADYVARTDGQPIFLGFARKGRLTSEDAWLIYKFTYDVNDQVTLRQSAKGTWDDRAALSYT